VPRHVFIGFLVVLCVAATVGFAASSGGHKVEPHSYVIEFDNAFGLTTGSDVKFAGVDAGTIKTLGLNQRTRRALVGVHLTAQGFDTLNRDAFCQVRPQSLIGEYYIDCQPGRGRPLPAGGHLPVTQTGSAIGIDLLNTIERYPNNERLRLLLGELGAGVASRGPDLNLALRRSLPALRQTNRVLRVLAQENHTLADLVRNGDRALAGVAARKREVARFVAEAGRTSQISARRRAALAQQWQRYPGFLDQLTPAMRDLGQASDAQTGALRQLTAGSDRLKAFFDRLRGFSRNSPPAIEALGQAAKVGRATARTAKPALAQLNRVSVHSPELARNGAIVLQHLDDRNAAVEPDARSPGGKGFTGLEAVLRYVYTNAQAVNIFNGAGYMLKIGLLSANNCGNYADVAVTKQFPECRSWLGPNQLGITTGEQATPAAHRAHTRHHARRHARHVHRPAAAAPAAPSAPSAPAAPKAPDTPKLPPLPKLPDVPQLPPLPTPPVGLPGGPGGAQMALDYLLGP
jgi:virulence factor Mce-like protein